MATSTGPLGMSGAVRSATRRVVTYLGVNLAAIWGAVLSLLVLDRVLGPSTTLRWVTVTLVVGGSAYGAALVLARSGRLRPAAGTAVLATWAIAVSLTWSMPIIVPVAILMLHVPSLILTDAFGLRTRTTLLGATVLLSGLVVVVGESRRAAWDADHPDLRAPGLLVALFTVVVAAVIVAVIRDHMLRMARHTQDLQRSRARLADAALDARRALERDLHDGAQQRLTTLAVDLGRVARMSESDPARAHEVVVGLQGQLQEAIRELRDLARGIYPPVLEERGLAGALPAAARRTSLPCVVEARLASRHEKAVEAAVYFCCLEAMQNADRHSGGRMITVTVLDDDDPAGGGLQFSVTDDGAGVDLAVVGEGHGLTGMRDRIHSAGGELEIDSVAGEGTRVAGHFPPGTAVAP